MAASLRKAFVTVESDPFFLRAVRKKIEGDGLADCSRQIFHYADIGPTRALGYPILAKYASQTRLEKFRRYSDPPEECLLSDALPDLVLVDGRFRAACALKSLRALQNAEHSWTIIVDDYAQRAEYHVIEEFAEVREVVADRMAVIESSKAHDADRLDRAIKDYETVPI